MYRSTNGNLIQGEHACIAGQRIRITKGSELIGFRGEGVKRKEAEQDGVFISTSAIIQSTLNSTHDKIDLEL